MRKLLSALLVMGGVTVALSGGSPAGAAAGSTTIKYRCVATYGAATLEGPAAEAVRDAVREQLNSTLGKYPFTVKMDYSTPTQGSPGRPLKKNPTFTAAAPIERFEFPKIDGVIVDQATMTMEPGGYGTIILDGAGVSPTTLQQSFPIQPWSPLDLKNPPPDGVSGSTVISGGATPTALGAIAYKPGPVQLKASYFINANVLFTRNKVTQPTTIDCQPIAPATKIGSGTNVVSDPYPCRADRPAAPHTFGDVAPPAFYNDSVSWLVASNITSGIAAGVYAPNGGVTRGQMAAFLWRLQCSPASGTNHSFGDVAPPAFFDTPVSWLVEAGVTGGVAPGVFSPNGPVTRGQMAAFLWRLAGSPAPGVSPGFTDVEAGKFYTEPVAWLVESGITTGVTATTFAPDRPVTRGQMAVFLDRYDQNT